MVPSSERPIPFSTATRFSHNPRLAKQLLGGKAVVLHYEGRKLFGLNENGSQIWGLLDGSRTVEEITRVLAASAGQDEAVVAPDVHAFLRELVSRGLIVEAPAGPAGSHTEPEAAAPRNASEDML